MRVAAFPKYGVAAASTRQRLLQFIPALCEEGISIEYSPLLDDDYVRAIGNSKAYPAARLARSYSRRFGELVRARRHDALWIYAELFPYLPAPFERIAFLSGKPVVYDFDDAFFLRYEERAILAGKLDALIAGAAACSCGNEHLLEHALRLNPNSILLPTVVDTERYRPAKQDDRPLTIGWIGSPSTWQYVRPLLPLVKRVCDHHRARLLVVGAGPLAHADRFARMELREWREESELDDLHAMDIGIMPLPDEPWARGKSGFKLIQYMACALPAVASPIGANCAILEHGVSGFHARTSRDWTQSLEQLLRSPALRSEMGARGRQRVVEHYSLKMHAPRLVQLFRGLAGL